MKSVYTGGEKVAEFESYDELRVGDGKPAFIYEGNELVYPNPIKDGLVLWYDFSGRTNADGQRGIAEDLSGNGNHGTLQNFNYSAESGYDRNKLLFDGVDDYIDTADNSTLQITKNITLEALFYVESEDLNIGSIMVKGDNSGWSSNSYGIRQATTNEKNTVYKFFLYGEDPNNHSNRIDVPISVGEFVYLSAQANFDAGEMRVYRNGVLLFSQDLIGIESINTKGTNLKVGTGYHSSFLNGSIYSARIYNKALTPEEIAHNYAIEKERFGIE